MKRESYKLVLFNMLRCICICIFSLVVLVYLIPFSIKNLILNEQIFGIKELIDNYTLIAEKNKFFFSFIFLFLPVLTTLITFRYVYLNKEKAIKIRTEFSRKTVFLSNFISSLTLIIIPYLLTFAVTLLVIPGSFITAKMTGCFFVKCIVFSLFVFSICLFVTVTVRTVVIQSIYVLAFLFIPPFLEVVLSNSVELLLKGFVMHLGNFGKLLRLYPVSVTVINNYNMNIINVLFYSLFALLMIYISYNIYVNNIPIKSDGYIRYESLKGFYRFVFFVFFAMTSIIVAKDSLLILLICSFVNLILCELILNGKLGINKGQKWYIVFIGALVVVFSIFRFDLYNIKEREIYVDEVSAIYTGTDYYNIDNLLSIADNEIVYDFENVGKREFEELTADKINIFINFHKKIMNESSEEQPQVYIAYKLKDGEIIIRKYRFDYRRIIDMGM